MLANYTRSAKVLSDLLKCEGVEDQGVLDAIANIPAVATATSMFTANVPS